MKIKSNRFALFPVLCTECQRYIFLEPYRKGERYSLLAGHFLKVSVCKDCYDEFKFGNEGSNK